MKNEIRTAKEMIKNLTTQNGVVFFMLAEGVSNLKTKGGKS